MPRACSALAASNATTWARSAALAARSSAMTAAWTAMIASRSKPRAGSMASGQTGGARLPVGHGRQSYTALVRTVKAVSCQPRDDGGGGAWTWTVELRS
jgi:uncharacterized protein (DUF58 family)